MFCGECGQLVPQAGARPPVPPQFTPLPPVAAPAARPAAAAPSQIAPVPLPGSLPWQQAGVARPEPVAPQPVPAERPKPSRIELAFSTGQRVVVGGSAVIGRKPEHTALATGAQPIEVQDDTRSVSRVHLFLELADGVITVGDAGSSNGSSIERAGVVMPLESAGERLEVFPGDRVRVGDIAFEIRAF